MPKTLKTKEIKSFKEELVKEQKGIDPLLGTEFPIGSICLDHDHSSQHVRSALHLQTNAFEGKVINAYTRCLSWLTGVPLPQILRNLAAYLEADYSKNPYHPSCSKVALRKFKALPAAKQNSVLLELGASEGSNSTQRVKLFNQVFSKLNDYERVMQCIQNYS
jgi:hypothetical protein